MSKDNIKYFLSSISVVHQWPMADHLHLLLSIDPKHFKKCMQLMDIRYFTLKLIYEKIGQHPDLAAFITMSTNTKTLIKIDKHPCLLQKNHYSLLEKILMQLQGPVLLQYGCKYMHHLPHPEKLFSFLLESLDPSNEAIIDCLEALMYLMVKKNLQVGQFFTKVYDLLPWLVSKPKSLELVNTMLHSIGLSHVYLRNYFKLLSVLTLFNDPNVCSRIAVLLCNLIRQYKPALWDLIHDTEIHPNAEFTATSEATNQCYEMKALQKHYHSDISGLFESFSQEWINMDHKSSKKRAMWEFEDVCGIHYNCKDFEKTIKKERMQREMILPQLVQVNGRIMKKAPKLDLSEFTF